MIQSVTRCACASLVLSAAAAATQAARWEPVGTATGGIAVYYNDPNTGYEENPFNVAYYRAQFSNSMTDTNGAAFSFIPGLGALAYLNDVGQYGFDLIVPAPTVAIAVPELLWYDNNDGTHAGATEGDAIVWACNDYKGNGPSGPDNPDAEVVNSLLRGVDGSATGNVVEVLDGDDEHIGWQVEFEATLVSDGIFHWYDPALGETAMADIVDPTTGDYLSGVFRMMGTFTYLDADDHTLGMDFYAGESVIEAEVVAEPTTVGLLMLGGLLATRRRRR